MAGDYPILLTQGVPRFSLLSSYQVFKSDFVSKQKNSDALAV